MGYAQPGVRPLGSGLNRLNIRSSVQQIAKQHHRVITVDAGCQRSDGRRIRIQNRTLVTVAGTGAGRTCTCIGSIIILVSRLFDTHADGVEQSRFLVMDTHHPLDVVGCQNGVVALNTGDVAHAQVAVAVAVVRTVQCIHIDVGAVGRFAVGQQDNNRLSGHGDLTLIFSLTNGGGVFGVITNIMENVFTDCQTGLRVGTDALIQLLGIARTAVAANAGVTLAGRFGFQGVTAHNEVLGRTAVWQGFAFQLHIFSDAVAVAVICGVAVQRQQLPGTGGVDGHANPVCRMLIQELCHGVIEALFQRLNSQFAIILRIVGGHTARNVQHEHNVHGSHHRILLGQFVFLTQCRQGNAEGICRIRIECAVVIIAVDNRLVRKDLAVVLLVLLKVALPEFVFDIRSGRIREVLTGYRNGGVLRIGHCCDTGQRTGGSDETAVVGFVGGHQSGAAAFIVYGHILGNLQ